MQKLGGFPVNSKLTVSTINVFFAGLPLLQYVYSGTRIRTRVLEYRYWSLVRILALPVLIVRVHVVSIVILSTSTRVHVYGG